MLASVDNPIEYLEGVAYETPVFVPGYTAAYANGGFALIATAVERMTGIPWEELVDERLVSALNLTGTSYTVPSGFDGNYVIPASPLAAGWDAEFEVFGA